MHQSTLLAVFVTVFLALHACAATDPDPAASEAADSTSYTSIAAAISEGSSDAIGLVHFANDAKTTVALLDDTVGLDARAAKNILARRNGPDGVLGTLDDKPFNTVADIDAVPYVGTAALDALLTYARGHGWVDGNVTLLGTFNGVPFTVGEGTNVLALANSAKADYLKNDLHLAPRAADNIVQGQPIASIQALSELGYLGPTALKTLKLAASAPKGAEVAAHLTAAAAGLLHTSESDFPFTLVRIQSPGQVKLLSSTIKAILAPVYVSRPGEPTLDQRSMESKTLAQFFDHYVVPQPWWEDQNKALAPRFAALQAVFQTQLIDVHVFRLGSKSGNVLSGAIDVFILGRSPDGEVVGLQTISVET